MKETFKKIIATVLAVYFCLFCMLNLASPKSEFSENENRYLAKLPDISFEKIINGEFMSEFESYTSDQFFLRDFFVSLKARIEKFFMRTENNGVYFCDDGYLIEKPVTYEKYDIDVNLEALKRLKDLKRYNVNLMVVPNAYEILKDKLPENAYKPVYPEILSYINSYLKGSLISCNDPTEILNENKDEYVYYRTDHHQTAFGGYLVYKKLSEILEFTPLKAEEFSIEKVSEEFLGTTWSKAMVDKDCADTVERYVPKSGATFTVDFPYENKSINSLYSESHLKTKDKYAYYLDGNHGLTVINSSVKNGKQLMLIKDSYAHNIAPFLANHYEKIHLIDLRYFNTDILEYLSVNNITNILALYSLSGFATDTNLTKITSWCKNSPYAKQPFGTVFETAPVSDSYFNDAVFIGDSLTEGLRLYNSLGEHQFLSYVGMSLYGIGSLKFPNEKGEPVYSVIDMLASMHNVKKIYIMLGTNDHIAPDVMEYFIDNYGKFIDNIRKYRPDAMIYIQSILPVTPKKELEGRFKNEYIYMYNDALLKLAKEKKCYFIDLYNMCSDENGNLISEISPDGIHLNIDYYKKWYSYLKTHAVGTDNVDSVSVVKPVTNYVGTSDEAIEIAEALKKGVPFSDVLWQIDNSIGVSLYGVDASWVKSAAVYAGSGATAEEIAIFEYKDKSSANLIKAKISEHLNNKKGNFENYLPSEVVKLSHPCIRITDKYVVLCVSDYNKIADEIISKYTNIH